MIRELVPAVAVVALRLPELGGIEIPQSVALDKLAARVLLLTAFVDEALVYRPVAPWSSSRNGVNTMYCTAVRVSLRR